jgi:ligand-binding sensor domain-containing protein/two-component sensor histidine kinase
MFRQLGTLVWVFLVMGMVARAERLPIKTYTTADGLADNRVICIVPDSRGFIWLCGPRGLSRFDGQGFTTYGIPHGLANTQINDFLETRDGVYWVATNGGGIYRFTPLVVGPATQGRDDAGGSRFASFPVGTDLQTNRVNVLHEDHDGRLWAGTDGGLFILDDDERPAPLRRVDLGLAARPDRAVQIWSIIGDRAGGLWIGTSWGLLRRFQDGRTLHLSVQPVQGTDNVRALLVDQNGLVWVGHDTGLIAYYPSNDGTVASVFVHTTRRNVTLPVTPGEAIRYTTENGMSEGAVRALQQSTDGHIWIGTLGGLARFDGKRFGAFTGAQRISTRALGEDRDGNLWIGSPASGSFRLARGGFTGYTEADGLADTMIGTVFENAGGDLYAVTSNQRAHRFDGIRFTAVRPNLSRDVADPVGPGTALQDRKGEWWVPGGAGLYRFPRVKHLEQLGHTRPRAIYTTRDGLAGDDVFRLFEDSHGDIWIGRRTPTSFVLSRWERATNSFHTYSDTDGLPAFNRVMSIAEAPAGQVWFGFWNGGLARYRNGRFDLFTEANGAPGGAISALYVDSRNQLWVGARTPCLSRVDSPAAERPRFLAYTTAPGLSGDAVGLITEDRLGRLYLGMSSGRIARLDPATGRVRNYTAADGLTSVDFTTAFRDRRGNLWFGTYNGLFRLVPEADRPPSAPTVLIAGVRVAGRPYLASDLGQRDSSRFELGPNENHVQVDFFAVNAGPGNSLRYQHRLEGAERDWSPPTEQRTVNYASLSPGRYRFVVRAATADGVASQEPATVAFTILPPVWQRSWFQGGALAGALLLVIGVHRNRVARLLALERVRMRIAADLHDDVGGSLSRISIQSEVARREAAALGEEPVRRLTEIADSARELIDALADVVWSVDPRRDDLASVCRRIREYADDVLLSGGVRVTFTAPSNLARVKLDPQARRNLFLLFKEGVTNVARHACARSVSLDVAVTNRDLRAELRDDGCGLGPGVLDSANRSDRHGIASMRERAGQLGGQLTIESAGTGTTLTLHMPIRHRWSMTMLLSGRMR